MALLDSLLTAIVRADGDALVMHVGERPYVVAPSGPVELSSRSLTLEAVSGMLGQLLPGETRQALDELGAIEHELPASDAAQDERFTVVAARGGDDIWIEVRRHRREQAAAQTGVNLFVEAPRLEPGAAPVAVEDVATGATRVVPAPGDAIEQEVPAPGASAPSEVSVPPVEPAVIAVPREPPEVAEVEPPVEPAEEEVAEVGLPDGTAFDREAGLLAGGLVPGAVDTIEAARHDVPDDAQASPTAIADEVARAFESVTAPAGVGSGESAIAPAPEAMAELHELLATGEFTGAPAAGEAPPAGTAVDAVESRAPVEEDEMALFDAVNPPLADPGVSRRVGQTTPRPAGQPPRRTERLPVEPDVLSSRPAPAPDADAFRPQTARPVVSPAEPPAAVVVSLPRSSARPPSDAVRPVGAARATLAERLLQHAVSKGAQGLLVSSGAKPAVRIDGAVAFLDDEAPLDGAAIEAMLVALAPDRHRDAVRAGASVEWVSELADVGRVRVVAFRDHRGSGCVLSLVAAHTPTVEQIGLAREIQALVLEGDGLVLVAGPRASGKSTLLAALVDLVNTRRGGYAVTIERQVRFVHESRAALVSQREVMHASHQGLAAWAALREDPDVLVIDDLRAAGAVEAVIDAVAAGRLVVAAVMAHGAADGIDRLVSLVPPESRAETRLALSGVLRAVVSQVLLRKVGGGRVAARELLLNSPEVSDLVAGGRTEQLPAAQDAGREAGMIPLADALLAFVQSGVVDAREAYRQAFDRPGFLSALRREGLDTSFVERLA